MKPRSRSFALDLSSIASTEYYAGLFTSSAKATLYLSRFEDQPGEEPDEEEAALGVWLCEVCGFRNPPGSSPTAAKCGLCGVPRAKSTSATTPRTVSTPASAAASLSALHLSSSLPTSPMHTPGADEVACPACTFLNPPSRARCEICDTPLPRTQPLKSAPASRPTTPGPDGADDGGIIKLSFRKGGDKALYALLKRSLHGKAWEAKNVGKRADAPAAEGFGIDGLVRGVETSAQSRQVDMHDALKDLDALMIKAREMVRLANELNERLTASSSTTANPYSSPSASASSSFSSAPALVPSTEPEEATFIRSSLAQLGLQMENTPVTLDMIRDEKRWHEELARELAGVLQGTVAGRARGGILGARGIVALDEVWGGWNRARGVALITPEQFLQVLPHLPAHTEPPLLTRAFARTGLRVLHTPAYTPAAFAARLHGLLLAAGPRTALEVAWDEDVPVGLVAEMVGEAEAQGTVVRDVAGSEVRWWTDVFTGYVWDGQE